MSRIQLSFLEHFDPVSGVTPGVAPIDLSTRTIERDAVISDCGLYRYSLTRSWGPAGWIDSPGVIWVMLNPSGADAVDDDPTCKKCMGYASRWGFQHMTVVNLYAWRETYPDQMREARKAGHDVVGQETDARLRALLRDRSADTVVCGWGANAEPARSAAVLAIINERHTPFCLRLTKAGQPWHPLYVPYNTSLIEVPS